MVDTHDLKSCAFMRAGSSPAGGSSPSSIYNWEYSSVGRASALQAERQRFEPVYSQYNYLLEVFNQISKIFARIY